jgi:hypothetical protein
MDDVPLVRAMPRRPLYALKGFITRIDFAILTAIEEEGWFAIRDAIRADVDCKEVRLAVVVTRAAEVLVGGDGRLAHDVDIGPECEGLAALKQLAKSTGRQVAGCLVQGVELNGYVNEDADPVLRHAFFLVYRAQVPAGTPAPAGTVWSARAALPPSGDPLSARIAGIIP